MASAGKPLRAFISDTLTRRPGGDALWRLCGWGICATVALCAVAVTAQSDSGSERLTLAFTNLHAPAQAALIADAQQRAASAQAEAEELAKQVRALTADRDRLAARIAGLEHNFEDMTGTIKRVEATRVDPVTLPKIAPTMEASAPPAPPPAAERAVTTATVEPPAAAPSPPPPPPAPPAPPVAAAPPAAVPSIAAPEPPATKIAAASAAAPAPPSPAKTDIGIDIGGSSTLALLNARWTALKAHHGPLLVGLLPRAAQVHQPGRLPYRLLLGPFANAEAATRLCAVFAAAKTACRPARFEGAPITP